MSPDEDFLPREFTPRDDPGGGGRMILAATFAIALFVTVFALSARQATEPATARRLLAAGIASLTDIDATLAQREAEFRQLAATSNNDPLLVPGYPVAVPLTREEALTASVEELRRLILLRSADIVYLEGLDAFDQTGDASVDLLSSEGQLKLAVEQISSGTNRRADRVALVGAIVVAISAAALIALARGYARLRILGWAAILAAVPALLITVLLSLAAGSLGGDDPFMRDLGDVVQTGIDIPRRNALIVLLLGAVVLGLGVAGPFIERRITAWTSRSTNGGPSGA